jgi:hypothetical protein
MDILAAIKREERKLEKQLGKLQHQLCFGNQRTHAAEGGVSEACYGQPQVSLCQ